MSNVVLLFLCLAAGVALREGALATGASRRAGYRRDTFSPPELRSRQEPNALLDERFTLGW